MQNLDLRLSTIADMVNDGSIICDVGTDHGYLPAYLLEVGKANFAYAVDINQKPLKSAELNLHKFVIANKAKTVLSDGLKSVPQDGITDVIIAGMGAEMISSIISKCEWIKNNVNIVLQPMTRVQYMRKWLCENGFEILTEYAVKDAGHFYCIQKVKFTGVITECNDIFELIGKINCKDEFAGEYINMQIKRLIQISEGLKKSKDFKKAGYYNELAVKLEDVRSN